MSQLLDELPFRRDAAGAEPDLGEKRANHGRWTSMSRSRPVQTRRTLLPRLDAGERVGEVLLFPKMPRG